MDVEKIRQLRRAYPFKPFNLVMKSGRKLLVDHPYFLGIEPDGQFLIWSSSKGGFEKVLPTRVSRAIMVDRPPTVAPRTNGKRSRG
jgi:hypothetical protein